MAKWKFLYVSLLGNSNWQCTECGHIYTNGGDYHYCPNCGADMKDEQALTDLISREEVMRRFMAFGREIPKDQVMAVIASIPARR